MRSRALVILAALDVAWIAIFVPLFIWRLQFTAPRSWIVFPLWLLASFLLHRDSSKTLGWRADNLAPATKQAAAAFSLLAAAVIVIGLFLHAPNHFPAHLFSARRLWNYFAFCLLQQVALESFLTNRLLFLLRRRGLAAVLAGGLFAIDHLPNPVLVPATLVGGIVMAWLFARQRNILPLAIGQAILGSLVWWAFPMAWHHHLRVGPGYYWPLR
jgi:Type II CAAX prenyl endopeptidase Rce1-like